MESTEHLVAGIVPTVGWTAVYAGDYSAAALIGLAVYGVALSVFVDLDHFLLARFRAGDWSHLRSVLASPRDAVRGQEWIFSDLVMYRQRLASHAVIGALLVGLWYPFEPAVAALTALVLGVHVCCDVLRDGGIA